MTPAQFKEMVERKLYKRRLKELTWAELVTVVQSFSVEEREVFLNTFRSGRGGIGGEQLQKAINAKVEVDAKAEATTILGDSTLSEEEFLRIFGND